MIAERVARIIADVEQLREDFSHRTPSEDHDLRDVAHILTDLRLTLEEEHR